jgi:Rrf2 family cysteine metabolism transcriptional repressor
VYYYDYFSILTILTEGQVKISTRGRYGTRALLDLAISWGQGPVQLKDIAQNQKVSLQYLEHLMRPLIAAGLVRSMRGAHGGVWLAKPPEEIKLSEVIAALVGSIAPVGCIDDPAMCDRSQKCATRDVWCELAKATSGVLDTVTLQDLVIRQKER